MPKVQVVCKNCGATFAAGMNIGSKETFEAICIEKATFDCPECGQLAEYDKKDMAFKEAE